MGMFHIHVIQEVPTLPSMTLHPNHPSHASPTLMNSLLPNNAIQLTLYTYLLKVTLLISFTPLQSCSGLMNRVVLQDRPCKSAH